LASAFDLSRSDDAATLAGLAEAKPEAFHRFFEEWFPRVYAFAARDLGSRPLAEAVTRRSLRRALADVRAADPTTPLAAWLLAHVRHELAWARRGTPP
jgi:DNA-directed RNA polymerase specialized sigma24 family protein